MDQFRDLQGSLPALKIRTIFDVGVNGGQSARAFRKEYPDADICAFEPVQTPYAPPSSVLQRDEKARIFQIALGDQPAQLKTEVEADTGDGFCASRGIEVVNFLKIDADGYDLKVCQGFAGMLERWAVDVVQVEAGLNPCKRSVPLQAFQEFLDPLGYGLFRLYDQSGMPIASRCSAVFVSSSIAVRKV